MDITEFNKKVNVSWGLLISAAVILVSVTIYIKSVSYEFEALKAQTKIIREVELKAIIDKDIYTNGRMDRMVGDVKKHVDKNEIEINKLKVRHKD